MTTLQVLYAKTIKYYKKKLYSRVFLQIFGVLIFLFAFAFSFVLTTTNFFNVNFFTRASTTPWTQTTWEGGTTTGTVNSTVTTYESQSNINLGTNGQFSLAETNAKIAIIKGDQLSTGSTNHNVSSDTSLKWNTSQRYNDDYYTFSGGTPTRLVVDQDGDYFVSLTMDIDSDDVEDSANRSGLTSEIRVNGSKIDIGEGRSSYIRNYTGHFQSSNHLGVLLEGLSASDYIEVYTSSNTSNTSHTLTSNNTLYLEKIDSSETIFSATATQTSSGTNLNTSAASLEWNQSVVDSGFTHTDTSTDITIDSAGYYFVAVNVPLYASSSQRPNVLGSIRLDGSEIDSGQFAQGYIRNASGHSNSSIHWSGVVQTTTSSQDLSISLSQEAASGTVTVGSDKATIFIQKIASTGLFIAEATQAGSSDNWSPDTAQFINWATENYSDTDYYTHSTSSSNQEITVNEDGDYLLSYIGTQQGGGQRTNPMVTVLLNGSPITGAVSSTGYVRNSSAHDTSSNNLLLPLSNLSANDVISLQVVNESEGITGSTMNDKTPAQLALIKKGYPNSANLVSNIFDAEYQADWGTLTYNTSGTGTVIVKVRSDSNSDMSGATAWASCSNITSGSTLADNSCVTDTDRYIQYQVTLQPSNLATPIFEDISFAFSASDQTAPDTQASAILVKTASDGSSISSYDDDNTAWTSDSDPYISWTAGADNSGGSGLLGYCVYVGTTSSSDPRSTKGQLGTSPVDTTNTDCDGGFIVPTNSLDLSTGSYQGGSWMSTSGDYYVIVTAIDNSGNAAGSPFASFHYQYDGTAPTNVGYISAPSTVYGSVNDMTFNWPSSGGSISSDSHSGVLGWQYSLDGGVTWKGTTTHSDGYDYIPDNSSTYSYDLTEGDDGDDISVGTNLVYFRTVDKAGNFSSSASYRTASLEYGGSAPTFSYNCTRTDGITVTPSTNTSNSYALSWDSATATGVNTISSYYYMINVSPPSSLSTLQSNSTQYVPSSSTSVSTKALTGSVKGTNTVYVVAVDSGDNYSPSNCIKGEYILNSSLPDAPQALTAADSSIKSEEIWRASLSWSVPDYTGTGDLTYTIQRSTDNSSWSTITTTTGTSYTDTVTTSQTYYYRVGAYDTTDASEASPSYTSSVSVLPTGRFTEAPSLSSDPTATGITTKRASINWSTSRTSDSKIQYGKSSDSYFDEEPSKSDQVTSHTIALTNLDPGTKYYYRAKWTDEDGNTGISDEQTFTTDPAPSVSGVSVGSISIDSAIIKFTSSGSTNAVVEYGRDTSYGGSTSFATSTDETEQTVQLSSLLDSTQYHFRVILEDSEGDTYPSDDYTFETLPKPRISNIKIQQIVQAAQPTVLVSWDTNTEITSVVKYTSSAGTQQETDLELKKIHRILLRNLSSDQRYSLQVLGIDKAGNEALSDEQSFTTLTDTRPPQISNLIVRSSIKGSGETATAQIIVSWDTDEAATSQVEFGQGTGSSYPQKSGEESGLKTNHTVVLTNLSPAQVYHLRAVSKDSKGNKSESVDNVTVTPKSIESALDLVVTNLSEAFGFLKNIQ